MRLFVGLMVPKNIQEHIRTAWNEMETRPTEYQPMDPNQWHVTFVFLGEVAESHLDEISAIIDGWTKRTPKISFTARGFESFPPAEDRYLTVHLEAEKMDEIGASIEDLRAKLSDVVPTLDTKAWLPHISILRAFRDSTRFAWKHGMPTVEWTLDHVVLAKSLVGRTGPEYTTLKRFDFPQS